MTYTDNESRAMFQRFVTDENEGYKRFSGFMQKKGSKREAFEGVMEQERTEYESEHWDIIEENQASDPKPHVECGEMQMRTFLEHFANCIPSELVECICKRIQHGAHTDTNASVKDDETPADIAHSDPRPSGCEEGNEGQNQTIDSYSALDVPEVEVKQIEHEPKPYLKCYEMKMCKFLEHFANCIPPELVECICKRIQQGAHADANASVRDDETPADIAHSDPRPSGCEEGNEGQNQMIDSYSALDVPEVEVKQIEHEPEHHVECGEMQMRKFLEHFTNCIPPELVECICKRIQHGTHTDTNGCVKDDEAPADIAHSDPRPSSCEEGNEGQNQTIDSYSALDVPEVEVKQIEHEPKPYLKCYEMKMCKFLEHFANCIPPELVECICKRIQHDAQTDTNGCVKDDEEQCCEEPMKCECTSDDRGDQFGHHLDCVTMEKLIFLFLSSQHIYPEIVNGVQKSVCNCQH
ncbi:unnamed protein product [Mesocestoides corti]|uniref:Uncharacterized protein n=2 Tax=Mesocestoides corti TaxID=53468 RepID=A0A0R3U811_MESCO|nr:unnamed protein product [Mesocestoides corti]